MRKVLSGTDFTGGGALQVMRHTGWEVVAVVVVHCMHCMFVCILACRRQGWSYRMGEMWLLLGTQMRRDRCVSSRPALRVNGVYGRNGGNDDGSRLDAEFEEVKDDK